MKDNTTQATWNAIAALYEQRFMDLPIYDDSYDYFLQALQVPGTKVLDIGCGPGNILRYLSRRRPDLDLYGIDFAPNMIELAARNNPGAHCQVLDCRDIASLSMRFGGILCGFCIPYLSAAETALFLADTAGLMEENSLLYLSFVAGDPAQSGWQTGSGGQRMYFHYYQPDSLLQQLPDLGISLLQRFEVPYPLRDGSTQTHVILIARKTIPASIV